MSYKVYASEAYVNEKTSAKINELKASGGVGYTEPSFVLTYDGKGGESKRIEGYNYTKINQKGFDLCLVEKIAGRFMGSDEDIEVTSDLFEVEGLVWFAQALVAPQLTNDNVIALVVSDDEGVFVIDDETFGGYISRIHFSETIHTIDPKFLPTAKVINANEYGIDIPTIGMSGKKLTNIDTQSIFEEINKHKDFVIECNFETAKITLVPTALVTEATGMISFVNLSFEYILDGVIIHFSIALVANNTVICTTTQTSLN